MTKEEIIAAYEALRAKALFIVDDAPYWQYVGEPEMAALTIDGDTAKLAWPETESDYGGCSTTECKVTFPAELLEMSAQEAEAWRENERAEYDKRQALQAARHRAAVEADERAAYERLKAKFGA